MIEKEFWKTSTCGHALIGMALGLPFTASAVFLFDFWGYVAALFAVFFYASFREMWQNSKFSKHEKQSFQQMVIDTSEHLLGAFLISIPAAILTELVKAKLSF